MDKFPDTEMAKFAHFCEANLLRTRNRDYPPSKDEVIACLVSNSLSGKYKKLVLCYVLIVCKKLYTSVYWLMRTRLLLLPF